MRLVVDASALVAEALRVRGRELLAHAYLDLFAAAEVWSETEHEVRRRSALLAARGHLSEDTATHLAEEAIEAVRSYITIVTREVYRDHTEEARRRVPRDLTDAPTVALALALDCGIWTSDRDFFGCGVPVWTTETLVLHLQSQDGA